MSSPNDLARMVPGFEFLQTLMKGASASLPGVQGFGQWVAPTLDPEEIDKRIQELKTVQFWLEQNARLLGTTVQALEVQRMTLSTLQTMNLPLADLHNALQARPPAPAPAPAATPSWAMPAAAAAPDDDEGEDEDEEEGDEAGAAAPAPAPPPQKKGPSPKPAAAPAAIDPMQWWGALTQQFTEIAAKAVKDGSADAARHLAATVPAAAPAASATTLGKTAGKAAKKPAPAKTTKAARAATPRKREA
ncbi:MAG: hypothetical protein Q7U73_00170 [Rubrivivax sp.]|nr:hypothetical protein [Rubrivivax sp.]